MKYEILIASLISIIIGLVIVLMKLSSLEAEIYNQKEKIESVSWDTENLYNTISRVNDTIRENIVNIENDVETLKSQVSSLSQDVWDLKLRVKQRGLVNPSYSQLLDFIRSDRTNELQYIEENNKFVCSDFTNTFIQNFAKEGFFSCYAELVLANDKAHAIVSVNTTDMGIVYVEPQLDIVVKDLKVGDNYCEKINQNCEMIIKNIKSCFVIGD